MITSIISMVIAGTIITHKPIARAVERVTEKVSVKRQDKAARKAAMEKYMQMHALDIEH